MYVPTATTTTTTTTRNEPVGVLPVATYKPEERCGRVCCRRVFPIALISFLTSLMIACLVSGRWMGQNSSDAGWMETGLWGTCRCSQVYPCADGENRFVAMQAISCVAAGLEWQALMNLAISPAGRRIAIVTQLVLAMACLVTTVALFGHMFSNNVCTMDPLRDNFYLDWAFGVRCGETAIALILAGVVASRPIRSRKIAVAAAALMFLTVLTTTARGWASWRHYSTTTSNGVTSAPFPIVTEEYGLWDHCACQRTGDIPCAMTERLFRAAESFQIITVAFAVIITMILVGANAARRRFLGPLAWVCFFCSVLPWIFVAALWNKSFCGQRFQDVAGYRLHWGFCVHVAASGLLFFEAVILTFLRTYFHHDDVVVVA